MQNWDKDIDKLQQIQWRAAKLVRAEALAL